MKLSLLDWMFCRYQCDSVGARLQVRGLGVLDFGFRLPIQPATISSFNEFLFELFCMRVECFLIIAAGDGHSNFPFEWPFFGIRFFALKLETLHRNT